MLTTIHTSKKTAVARATDDRPWFSFEARHPRVHDVRIIGLKFDIHRPKPIGDREDLLPPTATIRCFEHTALAVRFEGVALRRDPNNVGVSRMNAHRADLTGVIEANEFPTLTAVSRFVHASAGRNIAAHVVRSRAKVNHVWIGF